MSPSLRVFSCLLSLPALCAPTVSPTPELETPIRAFCRSVVQLTRATELDSNPSPSQIRALRTQAEALGEVAAKRFPVDHPTQALLQAALGTLCCIEGDSERGEALFQLGSRTLALRLQRSRAILGSQHPDLVPDLMDVGLLYELAGLRAAPWRDEALSIRDITTLKPDPLLEAELAAAIEDRYGPFLTVAELDPMLQLASRLAKRWLDEPKLGSRTERILRLGLKSDAERVWHLVALHGNASLRRDLESLLDQLDSAKLVELEAIDPLCRLKESVANTRLEAPVRRLLFRIEKQNRKRLDLAQRRRLLEAGDDRTGALKLLSVELETAALSQQPSLLREVLNLSQGHPEADLLDQALPLLQNLAEKATPEVAQERTELLKDWSQCALSLQRFETANLLNLQADRLEAPPPEPPAIPEAARPTLDAESVLRARLQALPRADIRAWETLRHEVELLLGPHHPLIAEILLVRSEWGEPEALADAQAALELLEPDQNLELRMRILSQMASLQAREGCGSAMEQTLRQWTQLMEDPFFAADRFAEDRSHLLVSRVLYLWREQRVDEIEQLPIHLLGGHDKVPELEAIHARILRTARLQAILRAQGLP